MEINAMQLNKKYVLILLGPTGVGKSECAESVAQQIPAEIINMDIGSFYTQLNIGTAKPDWKKSVIPHHMFDIIEDQQNLSVIQYRTMVAQILNDVWKRGKLPILVGGSGFYLKSLFFPPQINISLNTEKIPLQDVSWEKLNSIDSVRAQNIHPNDTYRIARALELWASTGKRPSELEPKYDPIISCYDLVYLTRNREELYSNINKRVGKMIEQGLANEVYNLYKDPKWNIFLSQKKIIGYDDFFPYFENHNYHNKSEWLEHVIDKIKIRTRAYARRQKIFWNMFKKMLHNAGENHASEINLSSVDQAIAIQTIKNMIYKKHNT